MGKEGEDSIFDPPGKKPASSPSEGAAAAREMLEKMQWMGDDLQKKMDKICELCGMTRKELHAFIQNPQNFSPQAWDKAQTEKTKLEQQIYAVLGLKQKERDTAKQKQQLSKERKGKTLGGRKGWIQM